ncbi:MAG: DUF6311 domain-containing protein, partial [Oscillospiraceae bacterium]|nr:DUF6311 domain-containing protein [Oscillospiraceae bacterium]
IHAYFVPMLCAVLFASLLEYAVKKRAYSKSLLRLLCCLAAALAAAYSVGFFHTSASNLETGYGYFSMNLNSLFNPASIGISSWSAVLPVWKQGLGTYEGFNYLGLGALAACLAAFIYFIVNIKRGRLAPRAAACVKSHLGLCFVCLCLTAFAVSNVVTLNSFTLFEVELPWKLIGLLSNLRASGRLFWPVYYLIYLCAVLFALKAAKPKYAVLSLAVLSALQLGDMSGALSQKRELLYSETAAFSTPFTGEFWEIAAESYDSIFTLDARGVHEPVFLAQFAVDNDMRSNDPFYARYDAEALGEQIEEELERVRAGDLDENTLYITTYEGTFLRYADYFMGEALCARVNMYWYVCAPYSDALLEAQFGPEVYEYTKIAFTIADYTDEQWSGGVHNADNTTVCFYDNNTNRSKLEGALALLLDGEEYLIERINYEDRGWIIVKLDRSGEPLRGIELDTLKSDTEEIG